MYEKSLTIALHPVIKSISNITSNCKLDTTGAPLFYEQKNQFKRAGYQYVFYMNFALTTYKKL